MSKTHLIEVFPVDLGKSIITESKDRDNPVIKLKGVFQVANEKNSNNRIYPKVLLEREVERVLSLIKSRRLIGELDHPDSDNDVFPKLRNASHIITDLSWSGNKLYGVLEVLDTPAGRTLKDIIKSGVNVGISSRSVGSVRYDDGYDAYIVEDCELITWDVVALPSVPQAWLNVTEGVKITSDYAKFDKNTFLIDVSDL